MRKSLLIILSAILTTLSAVAQTGGDTKALMDRVSKKLQSYAAVKADFSFTLKNDEADLNDTQEGSLVLEGDKYKLKMMGILALCDGETLWTVNEELKEANILDPADNDMFNPKNIFTLYEKNFKYEPVGTSGDKVTVDLIPTTPEDSYTKLRMTILKSKDQIDEVTYYSTDGNLYIIKIKSLAAIPVSGVKSFAFDQKQFPGVKLIDMR
jgi:outer membrane lipoprotein-sorting protein